MATLFAPRLASTAGRAVGLAMMPVVGVAILLLLAKDSPAKTAKTPGKTTPRFFASIRFVFPSYTTFGGFVGCSFR
jgi:hypothetical protein